MINAKMVKEVCNKYIYDQCPAVVGVGKLVNLKVYRRLQDAFKDYDGFEKYYLKGYYT